jgi:hypothetical protein
MGRPRKQKTIEEEEESPTEQPVTITPPPLSQYSLPTTDGELAALMPINLDTDMAYETAMDLDLAFLDVNENNFDFMDLLTSDFTTEDNPWGQSFDMSTPSGKQESMSPWQMGSEHLANDIDFSSTPVAGEDMSQVLTVSSQESQAVTPATSVVTQGTIESAPGLTPNSCTSCSDQSSPPPSIGVSCGCVPGMYQTMLSLYRIPKAIETAIRVTRLGAKSVHDTVTCPICGQTPTETSTQPPIEVVQSSMMLMDLLPLVSAAYQKLLKMVDDEAANADKEQRKMPFNLSKYGGVWGEMAKHEGCVSNNLDNMVLEPTMWRVAVRALLRADVYGINDGQKDSSINQPGLKTSIVILEERGRQWQEKVNEAFQKTVNYEESEALLPGERTCTSILHTAKASVDALEIP